jgi:hypothetical protein
VGYEELAVQCQKKNLGAFLAQRAKNRAFRSKSSPCRAVGFPLQSLALDFR